MSSDIPGDDEITIRKDQLGAELRRQVSMMAQEALTDEAVETLIGPNGSEIQRSLLVNLPDGQSIFVVIDVSVQEGI